MLLSKPEIQTQRARTKFASACAMTALAHSLEDESSKVRFLW